MMMMMMMMTRRRRRIYRIDHAHIEPTITWSLLLAHGLIQKLGLKE